MNTTDALTAKITDAVHDGLCCPGDFDHTDMFTAEQVLSTDRRLREDLAVFTDYPTAVLARILHVAGHGNIDLVRAELADEAEATRLQHLKAARRALAVKRSAAFKKTVALVKGQAR